MLCFVSWWDEQLELKKNQATAKRFSRLRCKETKVTDQCDTIVIISRLLMNSVLEAKATTSRASTFQTFFQTSHCCASPGRPFNSCWLPKMINATFGCLPVCWVLYIFGGCVHLRERGTSQGSREISTAEGVDFPITPSFWWSAAILFIIRECTV